MELTRAQRIILPQVTERFFEADSSREPHGKREERDWELINPAYSRAAS